MHRGMQSIFNLYYVPDWTEIYALAKRLLPLIFFPYLKKIYGNGIIATVKNANKLVAH
jgi:hypothetical protein